MQLTLDRSRKPTGRGGWRLGAGLNARHHAAERGKKLARDWVDPYSSAPWFDGWREPIRSDAPWLERLTKKERPTATPRTWLLTTGWRRHGLLAFDDVPGR